MNTQADKKVYTTCDCILYWLATLNQFPQTPETLLEPHLYLSTLSFSLHWFWTVQVMVVLLTQEYQWNKEKY